MIDEDIIHDYLDGDLDEIKARELAQWLLAAPENRALFRREVAFAATLSERATLVAPQRATFPAQHPTAEPGTLTSTQKHREKSLRQHRPPPSRLNPRLFAFGTVAAAVVVISAILALQQSAVSLAPAMPELLIGDARGSVSVVRGTSILATLPPDLQAGDQLRIGSNASVRLDMDHGGTRIWAGADTSLIVTTIRDPRDRSGTRLDIAQGTLLIEAAPQPTNTPLRIRSTRSEAEVVGTVLSFSVLPERDRLLVGHGAVAYGLPAGTQRSQITEGGFGESDGAHLKVGRFDHQPPIAVTTARVSGFALVDDSTGMPIPGYAQLISGCVIDLAGLHGRKTNLRADITWPKSTEQGHVVFHYDDTKPFAEAAAPYTVLSDNPTLAATVPDERFANGIHAVVATPYAGGINEHPPNERPLGGTGDPGNSATLIFTVINATP